MDLNKVVSGLSSSGALSGFAGGLAGSALVGAISGKKGKKMAKGALKVGALAAVGGLAYTAYQKYTNNQSQAGAQATGTDGVAQSSWTAIPQQNFEAAVEDTGGSNAMLILRAMIAAASSDGHLDSEEQARVFSEAQKLDLAQDEKATLFDELQSPKSMSDIVAGVNSPELAVEVYAASLVAVDESRSEAQAWLSSLAFSLNLPGELVQNIHEQVASAKAETV